jgi:hypothetical protein
MSKAITSRVKVLVAVRSQWIHSLIGPLSNIGGYRLSPVNTQITQIFSPIPIMSMFSTVFGSREVDLLSFLMPAENICWGEKKVLLVKFYGLEMHC